MGFCNLESDLAIDDMISKLGGSADSAVYGRYFGDFENGKKLIDTSFDVLKRGSYVFAKEGLKLLRSHQMYGNAAFLDNASKVNALFVPHGESKVADDVNGTNKKNVPYVTMMYKSSPFYDRKFEMEIRGVLAGGTQSISADKSTVDYRSERMIRTVAAEKFIICTGANS